jgi:hypothetical protein
MQTETTPQLNLWHVDFDDLYARHLGRHSQFGINVAHLLALYGIWFGVYSAIGQAVRLLGLPMWWVVIVALAVAFLVMVSVNAPWYVTLASAAFLTIFVASVLAVPRLPIWSIAVFLALVPVGYKLQAWSHRVWPVAADMSEFNKRFPPGRDLNVILMIYEVPICLNYLVLHPGDWKS